MTIRAVHWHEGMFLRPQHFQAQQRHFAHQIAQGDRWNLYHHWGLSYIDIDRDALANHRLVINSLQARLHDGTMISIPEEGELPIVELKAALDKQPRIEILLGVPILRIGRANHSDGQSNEPRRFRSQIEKLEDENTGQSEQQVGLRDANFRILLPDDDRAGYEVIRIARIEKSSDARNTPQIDPSFIPPLLSCQFWHPLQIDILQSLYDRIGAKSQLLADMIRTKGIAIQSQSSEESLIVAQLKALNEAYVMLGHLMATPGTHPLLAYRELVRLVGQLAIFGASRRPERIPIYDHDDLGVCYSEIRKIIDVYLDLIVEPTWKSVPFIGVGQRMQVTLQPSWLEPAWKMYVGIKSNLPTPDVVRKFTMQGEMDMKIGSAENVDEIFRRGGQGLSFSPQTNPPVALPSEQGLAFFEINRDSQQQEEWNFVRRSLILAIRLNSTRIDGGIDGQKTLRLKVGGHSFETTLYVLKSK